ncbi:MAG TPA: TPM domain-containing protein [Candidatus Eisenbacteria bacterium]|nr:TPM domain-containing protein [Candidatus Eisenbacteria bacterium]
MISRWAARAPKPARILVLAIILVASAAAFARADEPVYPPATDYVVDTAGLLSDSTRAHCLAIAQELDVKTGVQLAVAVVPSIAPVDIDQYAVTLYKKWGVGSKKKDEGILFVVAQKERRVRFEVGYGLESLLPDGRVGGILRSAVVPHLHEDDWDGGVLAAVASVATIVAQDRGVTLVSLAGMNAPDEGDQDTSNGKLPPLMIILIGFIIVAVISNAIAQIRHPNYRRRGPWGGGGYWGGMGGFGGFGGGSSGGGGFGGFGGGSSGGGGASSGF